MNRIALKSYHRVLTDYTVTAIDHQRVILVGGLDERIEFIQMFLDDEYYDVEQYDETPYSAQVHQQNINSGDWLRLPDLNVGRTNHGSVFLGQKLYVIGGRSQLESNLKSVEVLRCQEID